MTAKVPTMDTGTVTPGMKVAAALRRKRKITSTTRTTARINSNCTSCTEARMVVVRSVSTSTFTEAGRDRKSTRLNSSHSQISYAVFCLKKKKKKNTQK